MLRRLIPWFAAVLLMAEAVVSGNAQTTEESTATEPPRKSVIRRRTAAEREKKEGTSENDVSVRRQAFNERLLQNTDNTPWKRIIYREINLYSPENAALYYPARPTEGKQNLFYTLFRLIEENKIPAYEYIDGAEIFDPAHRLNFKDFLERFGVLYEEHNGKIEVAAADVPGDIVRSYYIKEEYYFDPITSNIDVKVVAICPILIDDINPEEVLRYPLFWVKYSDCKPYLGTQEVLLSDDNNANTASLDSYFRRGLYKGEIYKTQNRLGKALAQYCPTADSLRAEQARIEAQLASFDESLWRGSSVKETEVDSSDKANGVTEKTVAKEKSLKTERAKRQSAKSKKQKNSTSSRQKSGNKRSARGRF
ncbi:type IX secretion system ring subunit PorN/GldN [Porphyromonas miyakawae]